MTSYNNVIFKDGYYIIMQGHTAGDIGEAKAIFETIDLEPYIIVSRVLLFAHNLKSANYQNH